MKKKDNLSYAEQKIKMRQLREDVSGHHSKIAFEAEVSPATVMRVLNGDYVNWDVIKAAIKVRDRIIRERNKITDQL